MSASVRDTKSRLNTSTVVKEAPKKLEPQANTIRGTQQILLAAQTELNETQAALVERLSKMIGESEANSDLLKQFIVKQGSVSADLNERMMAFLGEISARHKHELAVREQEQKARNELDNNERLRHKQLEDKERQERADAHRIEMEKITNVVMTFIESERKNSAEQRARQDAKDDNKRLQDNVGTRCGVVTSVVVILSTGTIVILTLGASIPVVSGVIGLGGLSLGIATGVGKVFWRGIRNMCGFWPSKCCSLEADLSITIPLLQVETDHHDLDHTDNGVYERSKAMQSPVTAFEEVSETLPGSVIENTSGDRKQIEMPVSKMGPSAPVQIELSGLNNQQSLNGNNPPLMLSNAAVALSDPQSEPRSLGTRASNATNTSHAAWSSYDTASRHSSDARQSEAEIHIVDMSSATASRTVLNTVSASSLPPQQNASNNGVKYQVR